MGVLSKLSTAGSAATLLNSYDHADAIRFSLSGKGKGRKTSSKATSKWDFQGDSAEWGDPHTACAISAENGPQSPVGFPTGSYY
jgi:hypothetical protein